MKKLTTIKRVVEKKTKEVYPSKKAMMKHEKNESKQTKMREGEIKGVRGRKK